MLMNMKELLAVAQQHHFAVGAFNICDSLLFKCVMEAAEENKAPVIVELAPPEFAYVGDSFIKAVVDQLTQSSVPCVLHLDHGKTLEDCMRAIRCGFTSIMIDGSQLSYEENIALTRQVSEVAHCVDVSVEGEIGTIGAMQDSVEGGVSDITYTKPEEVVDFMKRSHADTLAIAIGTAHGIYPKEFIPKLRLDILSEIAEMNVCPLVLHGGSANHDDEIRKACLQGISKVNIASDYRKSFFHQTALTLQKTGAFWTPDVYEEAIHEAKAVIQHKMDLFGCINQAKHYR